MYKPRRFSKEQTWGWSTAGVAADCKVGCLTPKSPFPAKLAPWPQQVTDLRSQQSAGHMALKNVDRISMLIHAAVACCKRDAQEGAACAA